MNNWQLFYESLFEDDIEMLANDINRIKQNKSGRHDLEYRWYNKEKKPVWINCRGEAVYDKENEEYEKIVLLDKQANSKVKRKVNINHTTNIVTIIFPENIDITILDILIIQYYQIFIYN